jgi:hypothetical protein
MLRRVALVRTGVSEELSAFFIMVTGICELATKLALTSNRLWLLVTASFVASSLIPVTLMKEAIFSSDTLVLTGATRSNIPEDAIIYGNCRKNLKYYIALNGWSL